MGLLFVLPLLLVAGVLASIGGGGSSGSGDDGDDAMDRRGTDGDDTMEGGSGNDTLRGEDGGDNLQGGDGNDVIFTDEAGQLLADNDIARGGNGNDTIHSHTGVDQLFGDAGNDTFIYNDLLGNRMLTSSVRIDGGTGTDTVVLKGQALPVVNVGTEAAPLLTMWDAFTSIERIDIEQDAGNQTLMFGYRDVQDMSSTDILTIDGNVGDQVSLFRFVTGDILEGTWVQGADILIGNELFRSYAFDLHDGGVVAQMRIDADIGVNLL